ncbi:cell division protein FtsL [Candidatus Saccharibacteria bacterium]|nr:cell division protein FtsL [Candidatus Saccharibacteria bacterium]
MIQKLQRLFKKYYPYVYELRDIRVAGLVVFGVVVLLISWSGVKSIETNYHLQQEISRLQQENDVAELENSNAKLENEYLQTKQYLELAARQNFGLALPGEKELIVPKEVALKYTVRPPKAASEVKQATDKLPTYQKNLQAWVDFFLHRTEQ